MRTKSLFIGLAAGLLAISPLVSGCGNETAETATINASSSSNTSSPAEAATNASSNTSSAAEAAPNASSSSSTAASAAASANFSANASAKAQGEQFPSFTARDLDGNEVTENIFAQKKLTVINIWGTFCPPCIGEMPELGKLARELPADAQLIGIVIDADGPGQSSTIADAKDILQASGADFLNLVPSSGLNKYLDRIDAVPTTIFVDSTGHLVGEPVVGAYVEGYRAAVRAYLNE